MFSWCSGNTECVTHFKDKIVSYMAHTQPHPFCFFFFFFFFFLRTAVRQLPRICLLKLKRNVYDFRIIFRLVSSLWGNIYSSLYSTLCTIILRACTLRWPAIKVNKSINRVQNNIQYVNLVKCCDFGMISTFSTYRKHAYSNYIEYFTSISWNFSDKISGIFFIILLKT